MNLQGTGNFLNNRRVDTLVVLILIIFSLIIWWPSRYFPYFWDSAGYVIPTALSFLSGQNINLISNFTNFAHPPLVTGLLAIFWKIGGPTQITSHIFMFPFLPIYLISTYWLSKKYVNRFFAIVATFMVAFSPVVLAEYLNIYVDLPAAALTLLSLSLLVYKKTYASIFVYSLAVLTKLPVLTLLPFFYFNLKRSNRWLIGIPIVVFVSWLLYHYQVSGWFLTQPGKQSFVPKTVIELYEAIEYLVVDLFIEQTKWIWLIYSIIGLIILFIKKELRLTSFFKYKDIIVSLVITLLFFVYINEFGIRYSLYFLPLYAISVCLIFQKIVNVMTIPKIIILIFALLLPFSQTIVWRETTKLTTNYEISPPTDLSLIDLIRVFREMSLTLQVNHPDSQIYGGFPEIQMITEPIQGYVTQPLSFSNCNQFQFNPDKSQIIIIHPYNVSQLACRQLLDQINTTQLNHFEKNGKWIELYQVTASSSATPSANKN